MKKTALALLSFIGLCGVLRAQPQYVLHASFPDGTGLEVLTRTTGSSPISPEGGMGIGPGAGSHDAVNRLVLDRGENILFAYNLEASRGASPGTVRIRIEPISSATEAGILKSAGTPGQPRYSGAHLPTVGGVREFPAVGMGQSVTLDILKNPSTGETIYDVLRPIPGSAGGGMAVTPVLAKEAISLSRMTLRVNGKAVAAPAPAVVGSAVRIDIPHLGTFVVAANAPDSGDANHVFGRVVHVDGKKLSWTMGKAQVEITSETNVLVGTEKGELWLFHDPHYQPDVVGVQSADTVDWLFPKREEE